MLSFDYLLYLEAHTYTHARTHVDREKVCPHESVEMLSSFSCDILYIPRVWGGGEQPFAYKSLVNEKHTKCRATEVRGVIGSKFISSFR